MLVGRECQNSLYLSANLAGCTQTTLSQAECAAAESLVKQVRFFTSGTVAANGSYLLNIGLSGPSLCQTCLSFQLLSGSQVFALNQSLGSVINGNWTQYQFTATIDPIEQASLDCSTLNGSNTCSFAVVIFSPGTNLTYLYPFVFITSQVSSSSNSSVNVGFALTPASSGGLSIGTSTIACVGASENCAPPPASLCIQSDSTCGNTDVTTVSTNDPSFTFRVAMNDISGPITPKVASVYTLHENKVIDISQTTTTRQGLHAALITIPTNGYVGNHTFIVRTELSSYNGTETLGSRRLLREHNNKRILQGTIGDQRTVTANIAFVDVPNKNSSLILAIAIAAGTIIFAVILVVAICLWRHGKAKRLAKRAENNAIQNPESQASAKKVSDETQQTHSGKTAQKRKGKKQKSGQVGSPSKPGPKLQ